MCDRSTIGARLRCSRCEGRGWEWLRVYSGGRAHSAKRTCPHCGGSGVEPPHTAEELSDAND